MAETTATDIHATITGRHRACNATRPIPDNPLTRSRRRGLRRHRHQPALRHARMRHGPHAVAPTPEHRLGVLSLIFWALDHRHLIKYLMFVLRADNHGEGGILALTRWPSDHRREERCEVIAARHFWRCAFVRRRHHHTGDLRARCDGRLERGAPGFEPIRGADQPSASSWRCSAFKSRHGRCRQGFRAHHAAVVRGLGRCWECRSCSNRKWLAAINPCMQWISLCDNGWHRIPGSWLRVLVVTGGEALYADMGHFGMRPIRLAWFALVLPALLLNYFGQGALLLENPAAAENPFYRLVPSWAIYPMVVLAAAAAVIASQAVITGAFSLTMQAVQLRVQSPSEDHPHFVQRVWADLHSGDQLGADGWVYRDWLGSARRATWRRPTESR